MMVGMSTHYTPQRIQAIRHSLGESTATFGARFQRSGRAVEDWEQGRRYPDPLVITLLASLEAEIERKSRRKESRKSSRNSADSL